MNKKSKSRTKKGECWKKFPTCKGKKVILRMKKREREKKSHLKNAEEDNRGRMAVGIRAGKRLRTGSGPRRLDLLDTSKGAAVR